MPSPGLSATPRRSMKPQRLLGAASGWFVAVTLFASWLLNLLPWGRWPGVPDFFGIVLLFWSVHAPRRVGMTVGFVGGLLLDVHNARLLGESALAYTLIVYWAVAWRGRILRFGPAAQTLHVLPVVVLSLGAMVALRSLLLLTWPGWWWLADCLVTALLWPFVTWLLQLPQRIAAGSDPT
ncbi:rod shape-determining protein MreD [Verticiella sediminum]|uniref:Rod shape-determining protein MreD n=2 Tax=Verticiella sediminum TaxID=1247510 RepID=A0A556B1I1_9BURK|nr:rod shape-determining protein MreD [Verticiella sediminum]